MNRRGNISIFEPTKFIKVDKSIITSGLGPYAIGLFVILLILGEKWSLNVKGLATKFKLGKDQIRRALSDLEKAGFLSRIRVKDPKTGKFDGWLYEVGAKAAKQVPRLPENTDDGKSPSSEKVDCSIFPTSGESVINKKNENVLVDCNYKEAIASSPLPEGHDIGLNFAISDIPSGSTVPIPYTPAPTEGKVAFGFRTGTVPYGEEKIVFLFLEEYDSLVRLFGRARVDNEIAALEHYILNGNGKRYKNHKVVLRNWLSKDCVAHNNHDQLSNDQSETNIHTGRKLRIDNYNDELQRIKTYYENNITNADADNQ